MTNLLTQGKILISEPFLDDPNFERSVVLVTEHNKDGTVGFILNKQTKHLVSELVSELPSVSESIYLGGPVGEEIFSFIHPYASLANSYKICNGIYCNGDVAQMKEGIANKSFDVDHFKFFVGYSGWEAGQLDAELANKAWIVSDHEPEYILNKKIKDSELWKMAIRDLEGDDALLANSPKFPFLN